MQIPQLIGPGDLVVYACSSANFYLFPPCLARPLARAFPRFARKLFLVLQKEHEYSRRFVHFARRDGLETNFYAGDSASLKQQFIPFWQRRILLPAGSLAKTKDSDYSPFQP